MSTSTKSDKETFNMSDNALHEINLTLSTEADTESLAQQLAVINITGSVWLSGDLGAGKTTLTRYWLKALGHQGKVKSPTYTLVEPYKITVTNGDIKPVYHADLYRLQDPEELEYIGFDEYLEEPNALIIIEWASRAMSYLPNPVIKIELASQKNDVRCVTISLSSPVTNKALLYDLQNIHI